MICLVNVKKTSIGLWLFKNVFKVLNFCFTYQNFPPSYNPLHHQHLEYCKWHGTGTHITAVDVLTGCKLWYNKEKFIGNQRIWDIFDLICTKTFRLGIKSESLAGFCVKLEVDSWKIGFRTTLMLCLFQISKHLCCKKLLWRNDYKKIQYFNLDLVKLTNSIHWYPNDCLNIHGCQIKWSGTLQYYLLSYNWQNMFTINIWFTINKQNTRVS